MADSKAGLPAVTALGRRNKVRAAADLRGGLILATAEVPASPATVFAMLASARVTEWWVRPGVFDTTEWSGEVRPGGRWRAAGTAGRGPYVLEGEFHEVDAPRRLHHTWRAAAEPAVTVVTCDLDAIESGTRITLRHSGFTQPGVCQATCLGWETSFERLAELLSEQSQVQA